MFAAIALASILVADAPSAAAPPAPGAAQLEPPRPAAGGRPAEDQVRLAYWCEAHGLTAERIRHLSRAVLADPSNVAARGLLGLVARDGRWARPEAVAERQRADPAAAALLAEYDAKRAATPYKAAAQFDLGAWAEERGLKEQARAHYTAAVRLDPGRDAAWHRLGYAKHDGRWATDAQLAAERADAEAQRVADRKWRPLLERWRDQLARPARRDEAEANLLAVTDPRAVPSILRVFAGREADQPRAVRLLAQVDAPAASRALAALAVSARSDEARRTATETLRGRDAREYADLLIAQVRDPIRYEVKPVAGPGSPGVLFVEGKEANVKRIYTPPPSFQPGDQLRRDPSGTAVVDRVVDSYSTGKPNVTGHSRYVVSGQAFLDSNGNAASYGGSYFDAGNYRGGGVSFGLGSFGPVVNPRTGPDPGTVLRQALAAGTGAAGSSRPGDAAAAIARVEASLPRPGPNQFNPSLAGMAGYLGQFRSGYYDAEQVITYSAEQLEQEQRRSVAVARFQLQGDVAAIEAWNRQAREGTDRALGVLQQATGADPGRDHLAWSRWWTNQLGFNLVNPQSQAAPTVVEQVPINYQPEATPLGQASRITSYTRLSCFGAGTLVQTVGGSRAIETLKVGDVVLTQSTSTGALGYQPILVVHHNPPSTTFRIKLGDDAIVSSAFHRFWVAGRGWVMARDLKAGDPIRVLGGVAAIESVETGGVQPVFNLDVADDADFFAGRAAALVHDNTLPDPRLVPFDRPADAKALAAR